MGRALRVLIIEDSENDTQLLLRELKRIDYEVEFERVDTAQAMQAVLTEKAWDLILSDYTMPRFSALHALEVLKASHLDLPFIIISGTIGEESAVTALKVGANDFLIKGNFARLGSVIERELLEATTRRERKHAEKALRTSEELFGTTFHHSPVGICITTLDGRLQNISQSLLDMLGFTRPELEGKHFTDITHPDDLEIGKDAIDSMISGKIPSVSFEKRYLHKTGEPVWALVSTSLLRDSSGQPVHFITHILNMTERKRAEEQLHVQAARLKVLADASQTFSTAVHDYQMMLEMVARQTAEVLGGFCGVRLSSADGEWLEMVAMHDVDSEALKFARRLSNQSPLRADEPNFAQRVLQSQQAFLMPGVSEDQLRSVIKPEDWAHLKYIASHSRLLAPIRTRNEALGFLIISRKVGSPAFDEQDLKLAQDLADRAALAISNARLYKQLQNELAERKQAEAATLESEARYHRVLDAMMEGCQIIDFDWRYVYVNDVVAAQGKYTREELLNHTMMEMYPGIENTELFGILRQCMEDRTPRRMENQFAFPDGSLGWFELSVQPAREGIFILSTDITERKRAEQATSFLATIVESSDDAIYGKTLEGIIVSWNAGAEKIFGYTADEAKGQSVSMLAPLDRKNEITHILEKLQREELIQHLETVRERKGGTLINVALTISPIRTDAGNIIGASTIARDITERKQAEERFHLAVESAPNAILLVNRQGIIEMVNSQAEKFFGYDRAELVRLNVDRLVPERLRAVHQNHRQSYLDDLETRPMGVGRDLHGLRKDGSEFPVEIGLTPITTQEGLLVLATIVDITERKEAEKMLRTKNEELKAMSQQLWQAAKLATMGELAASIAHELNNPLATVSLRTEMLQVQFTPEDPQSKSLQVIDSEIKRMSSLVGNLLQFSRRSSSQISTIQVNEELANTLELIQYHLRKNSILTVQELSPEIPLIQADRQQLRQVFLNLFTNAADAIPLGGILTIRTWSGEKPNAGTTAPLRRPVTQSLGLPVSNLQQVFIEVSDTGEGIPPDRLERVWEPFYTTKPEGKGTGLGLAICRRIIQEHGGTIEIISDGIPGKGTTVQLSLPALKER